MIALFNLLSRLSESIELVLDMAPTAEGVIEGAVQMDTIQNESSWMKQKSSPKFSIL